jgi:hypothetical protein
MRIARHGLKPRAVNRRHERGKSHHPPAQCFERDKIPMRLVLEVFDLRAQGAGLRQSHSDADSMSMGFIRNRDDVLAVGDRVDENQGIVNCRLPVAE